MSGLSTWFSFLGATSTDNALPEIFPFPFLQDDFVSIDVVNIYSKILTDAFERTEGLSDEQQALLFDNCVQSESSDGLITMLAKAMSHKRDLFLKYDRALKVVVEVKGLEAEQIREDYKKTGKSALGTFISFKNYKRTDMLRLYSSLEYCTVASLSKNMNLSKAVQIKISDLRSSVGAADSSVAKNQALSVAEGLKCGKDVLLDAKDLIETAKPDLTATQSSMEFIAQKQSFYLGLPASYITGEQEGGLGDSGKSDAKAVERGLKNYYFSVVKPVATALFEAKTTFKSDDFENIDTAINALKSFELTSDELMHVDNKRRIINKLFGLPPETKGGPAEPEPEPENKLTPSIVPGAAG